jgi:hypothetical protein
MQAAVQSADNDFVEGLFFEDGRFYLMAGRFTEIVPAADDILRRNIFYRLVESRQDIYLETKDYIFRYDPEWFWNIPDTAFYRLFRRFAPARFRNSSFYTRHLAREKAIRARLGMAKKQSTEPLIQDWEVPWRHAAELIDFCINEVDLGGLPWAAVPIVTPKQPTIYPIRPQELYFNLGCYCQVQKRADKGDFYYTRIMDDKCFELDGIKMLYSSTFLEREEFDARFNGAAYAVLKRKYDAEGNAPTLYEKVAMR